MLDMKIATYNIWNSENSMPAREKYIIAEIQKVRADILCLQEVPNKAAECTLNFRENPRFRNNTIELNARFDRIMLRNPYPEDFPVLESCAVFGKTVYEDIHLEASDHYGVVVEVLEFVGLESDSVKNP